MTQTELRALRQALSDRRSKVLRELKATKSHTIKNRHWGKILGYTTAMRLLGMKVDSIDLNGNKIPDSKVLFGINATKQ